MDYSLQATQCLIDLLRINSIEGAPEPDAPFGRGNREALDYTLGVLNKLGFRTFCGEGYYGYGEIGDDDKPLFGVLGHLDVVPVTEGWSHPPFSGEIADGFIWGRGAEDDKGPMIAALYAAKELMDEGRKPKTRLRFIFGSNEESGWRCMQRYMEKEEMPSLGFSPDADFPVINCEKGVAFVRVTIPAPEELLSLSSGTRANIVPDFAEATLSPRIKLPAPSASDVSVTLSDDSVSVKCFGKSAHGSTPEEGDNALMKLLYFIGNSLPFFRKFASLFELDENSPLAPVMRDEVSGKLTMNLGVARKENDSLVFDIDVRHPVSYKRDDVLEILAKTFSYGKVELVSFHNPLYVPKDHPLVTSLLEAYKSVTGDALAEPIAIGGATYARMLPMGVAFGPIFPGEKSYIHMTDERISVENFIKIKSIYKEALSRLCFE